MKTAAPIKRLSAHIAELIGELTELREYLDDVALSEDELAALRRGRAKFKARRRFRERRPMYVIELTA